MEVSSNGGTSKSSISLGFPLINHPFWVSPICGNPHIETMKQCGDFEKMVPPPQWKMPLWNTSENKKSTISVPNLKRKVSQRQHSNESTPQLVNQDQNGSENWPRRHPNVLIPHHFPYIQIALLGISFSRQIQISTKKPSSRTLQGTMAFTPKYTGGDSVEWPLVNPFWDIPPWISLWLPPFYPVLYRIWWLDPPLITFDGFQQQRFSWQHRVFTKSVVSWIISTTLCLGQGDAVDPGFPGDPETGKIGKMISRAHPPLAFFFTDKRLEQPWT